MDKKSDQGDLLFDLAKKLLELEILSVKISAVRTEAEKFLCNADKVSDEIKLLLDHVKDIYSDRLTPEETLGEKPEEFSQSSIAH